MLLYYIIWLLELCESKKQNKVNAETDYIMLVDGYVGDQRSGDILFFLMSC